MLKLMTLQQKKSLGLDFAASTLFKEDWIFEHRASIALFYAVIFLRVLE
jgi:hypothetical protein